MRLNKFALTVLSTILVLLAKVGSSEAGLTISPAFVDVKLDKARPSGEFQITNVGDEEERYRIKTMHFTFLEDGGLREISADEHSLAPWVKFNPKEFTLPPKARRSIRFVVTPPQGLRPGEYWGAMELEPLKTMTATGKDTGGKEYKIEVVPTILVPIFGTVGKVRYEGEQKRIALSRQGEGVVLDVLVENTGNGRLYMKGDYEIVNDSGEIIEKDALGGAYIMPGSQRRFTKSIKTGLNDGNYTVKVQCSSPQLTQPIYAEFQHLLKTALK